MSWWETKVNLSSVFLLKSLQWSRAKYVDGMARDTHYKLLLNGFYTNTKKCKFSDEEFFCKYCNHLDFLQTIPEDVFHVFYSCRWAKAMMSYIKPCLCRLANCNDLDTFDVIFGKSLHDKRSNVSYNFVLQLSQLAIWRSRASFDRASPDHDVIKFFKSLIFSTLCRVRTTRIWTWGRQV